MIRSQIHHTPGSRSFNARPFSASALLKLILCTVWLATSAVQAEFYKWVDDTGRIHYSEIPPPSDNFQVIIPRSSPTITKRPETNEKPTSKSFGQKEQNVNDPAEKRRITEDNEQIRKKNCAAATHNLKTLQSSGRIKLLDEGEYRILSPEEKAAKISQSKKHVEEYCD